MSPIILVGASILLFGLGLGVGYWFSRREATKASDIQNELDDYRRHVTEHFSETAQHFQAIGQQYQSLYKHMAQGAEALCDPAESDRLLGFAAASTPAITASTADEPEKPPQVIKDYATAEEIEPPQVEPDVEAEDISEPLASVPDDIAAEPPAEDVVADEAATPTPFETQRTVH